MELYNEDCLSVMKNMADESIDLIVTDPPYKIVTGGCTLIELKNEPRGMLSHRKANTKEWVTTGKLFKHNEITFDEWLPELYRVLKPSGHIYIYINARNLAELQKTAEKVGFKYQNILIWNKGNANPNKYYLLAYEMILMLRKGKAKNIKNMGTSNILNVKNIIGKKVHPTEKPCELNKILIENSSEIGDVVFDPFMGSGSTGMACKETSREFIGIEIDKQYYDIAKERLKGA